MQLFCKFVGLTQKKLAFCVIVDIALLFLQLDLVSFKEQV